VSNHKQRDKNRATARALHDLVTPPHICRNCGKPGSHYGPAGFGSPGGYTCLWYDEPPTEMSVELFKQQYMGRLTPEHISRQYPDNA
jgi:hypothetical protein